MNSIHVIIAHGRMLQNDGLSVCLSHLERRGLMFGWQLTAGHSVGTVDLWADSYRGLIVMYFELEGFKSEMAMIYLKLLCWHSLGDT